MLAWLPAQHAQDRLVPGTLGGVCDLFRHQFSSYRLVGTAFSKSRKFVRRIHRAPTVSLISCAVRASNSAFRERPSLPPRDSSSELGYPGWHINSVVPSATKWRRAVSIFASKKPAWTRP